MSASDTIFALSSGRPPSAIAIVRLSGALARAAGERLAGQVLQPRVATYVTLRDAAEDALDEAVALCFPAPRSATGEDIVELHCHGSRAVLAAVFDELVRAGLRPAEPGEFTQRAFENGKLDLTEAEGLDDLIHADTDMQRRQALRQLKGLLGRRAENWRQQIIEASALIEAGIDFSDEGDVPDELIAPALERMDALRAEIDEVLASAARGERLREGLVVAIAGPPNAGKSTLLNRLAQREAAIVSPYAGTTRDVIEVRLDLNGYPVLLLDTAGIRDAADPVEQEGVRRARVRMAEADVVLWLTDATGVDVPVQVEQGADVPVWTVRNKIDAVGRRAGARDGGFAISAETGAGVIELTDALAAFAADYFTAGDAPLVTRARQRGLLQDALAALLRAGTSRSAGDEIVAEELRIAATALGRLLGRIDVEDILGEIFGKFCIGK